MGDRSKMTFYRPERGDEETYRYLPHAENFSIGREMIATPVMVGLFLWLLYTLVFLAFIKFPYYQAQASQNMVARITLEPPRGEILDRRGQPLAVNHAVYDCYFITSDDVETDIADLTSLAQFLGISGSQLEPVLESRRTPAGERSMASELWAAGQGSFGARSILVKRDLNQVEVTSILERRTDFPRAYLERSYRRSYPAGESTAQVIGYMGEISGGELGEWAPLGYRMGNIVGKAGLERQYDNVLRGRAGERLVSIDARGRILGEAEMVPAIVPGNGAVIVHGDEVAIIQDGGVADFTRGTAPVRVTMRAGVIEAVETGFRMVNGRERAIYRTLFTDRSEDGGQFGDWYVFRQSGEVASVDGQIAMRPPMTLPTGGMALRTTLDLDMQRAFDQIMGNHVGGVVAMDPRDGSILACVSEPGYDPNLFSPSGVDRDGWQRIMNDPNHPLLNRPVQNAYVPGSTFKIVTGLAAAEAGMAGQSWFCAGMIRVGDRDFRCWNRSGHGTVGFARALGQSCNVAFCIMGQELGHDGIAAMAYKIGLGSPTGVDLPGERSGLIPNDEWKRARIGERWYLGDTINMAIGQGFVQLSVLQVARITSVVANYGYLVTPHFSRLLTPTPSQIEKIDVSESSINAVRAGMRDVVTNGTARSINLDWIQLAGKTGTADDPPREEPHSWFTSFGPYSDPSLVIVVFCENGGHGDEKAVPLARRMWESAPVRAYLAGQ